MYLFHSHKLTYSECTNDLANESTIYCAYSNYIPNLLKSVLIIVPSQERSMYQYFEVAGFINRVKNAIRMIQSLLIQ